MSNRISLSVIEPTEQELFEAFNVDMSRFMAANQRKADNVFLWRVNTPRPVPPKPKSRPSQADLDHLRQFYEMFAKDEQSPFDQQSHQSTPPRKGGLGDIMDKKTTLKNYKLIVRLCEYALEPDSYYLDPICTPEDIAILELMYDAKEKIKEKENE